MAKSRRASGLGRAKRPLLPQRKLYIVVGEGETTEREYFDLFGTNPGFRLVYCTPGSHHGGNMMELVREMQRQMRKHSVASKEAPTEYWIIADVEGAASNRDLGPLFTWVRQGEYRHLGITNRQFENWLLLHFQKGMASNHPTRDLAKYIAGYSDKSKHIRSRVSREHVRRALENARNANVICSDVPHDMSDCPVNSSALPRLVKQIV